MSLIDNQNINIHSLNNSEENIKKSIELENCKSFDKFFTLFDKLYNCSVCKATTNIILTKDQSSFCKQCYAYLSNKEKHCKHGINKLFCHPCCNPSINFLNRTTKTIYKHKSC